ncbi:MAG: ABC transporter permease [Oscillospiraceae bacterium]|nr:ABC transporter permease [Oscillospiraceae bacterium]
MLFLKECKKILFSLTFVIYLVAVVGFYFTQFQPDGREPLEQPSPGLADYGTIAKEIPEILMPAAADGLLTEYLRGYYTAYPIGFIKKVKLSEKKSARIAEIITEITGISKQELDNFADFEEGGMTMMPDGNGGYMPVVKETVLPEVYIPDTMTYEHFRELMREADKIIGGGSDYADDYIIDNFSLVPKTYEDALADYHAMIEKDKVTSAYARLFCDYMGIIVSILPVFAAAALANADKKSRMEQLIYARKISSARLLWTRFSALVITLTIPVILLAWMASCSIAEIYPQNNLDFGAIPTMAVYWLLPNILFSSALGMVMTELSSPLMAIFVQSVLWFGSVMSSTSLSGEIGRFTLVCRHNSLSDRDVFIKNFSQFAFSRIFYTILALGMIALTTWIYSEKRKGGLHVISKDLIRKSEA